MQIHLDLSYASPDELRAFAQYINLRATNAETRQAEAEKEKREYIAQHGTGGWMVRTLDQAAGYTPETSGTKTEAAVDQKTEATTAPAPKKRATKPAPAIEQTKAEDAETCLDVKPSAETQQELPLEQAVKQTETRQAVNEPAGDAPTIDDLRRHLRAYGQGNGAEALSSLYAEYGAKQLSDLPADKYAEIIAKVSA